MSDSTSEGIIIKNESPPERCEICHQSDEFNPSNADCARCKNLALQTTELAIDPATPEKTLESLRQAQAEWEVERGIGKQKLEEDRKSRLTVKVTLERENLNRWRTSHAHEYEKSLNTILPLFFREFAPEVIARQSFEKKLVLAQILHSNIKSVAWDISSLPVLVFIMAGLVAMIPLFMKVPSGVCVILSIPIFILVSAFAVLGILAENRGDRSRLQNEQILFAREILRFNKLSEKWNQKIDDEAVPYVEVQPNATVEKPSKIKVQAPSERSINNDRPKHFHGDWF